MKKRIFVVFFLLASVFAFSLDFSEIQNIMKVDNDSLDKIVKDALFKLSVVDEKVELW